MRGSGGARAGFRVSAQIRSDAGFRARSVGSQNVSSSSESDLIEAALETASPTIVRACRRFIQGLFGDTVELEYAKSRIKMFRPPKYGR